MSKREFGSITVSLDGDVFVMRMHGGAKNQSVFNPEFGKEFHAALDYVEELSCLCCIPQQRGTRIQFVSDKSEKKDV